MFRMERQPTAFTFQPAILDLLEARFTQGDFTWTLPHSLTHWLTDWLTCCWSDCCHVFFSAELPPHLEKIKQQANDAFARQQWTQAIQLYSLGIHQASCNAMLYGNRAAAYMKRKWWELVCFRPAVLHWWSLCTVMIIFLKVATQIYFMRVFFFFLNNAFWLVFSNNQKNGWPVLAPLQMFEWLVEKRCYTSAVVLLVVHKLQWL